MEKINRKRDNEGTTKVESVESLRKKTIKLVERDVILINLLYDAIRSDYELDNADYIGSCNIAIDPKRVKLQSIRSGLKFLAKYSRTEVTQIIEICTYFEYFINSFIGSFIFNIIEKTYSKECGEYYIWTEDVPEVITDEIQKIVHSIIIDTMKEQDIMLARIDEFIERISLVQNTNFLHCLAEESRSNKR